MFTVVAYKVYYLLVIACFLLVIIKITENIVHIV